MMRIYLVFAILFNLWAVFWGFDMVTAHLNRQWEKQKKKLEDYKNEQSD